MSPEKATTVEPSPFKIGEGCQGWTLANPAQSGRGHNDHWSSHHHGGVGGRGMRVQVVDVREEISGGGPRGPTAGASGQTAKPVRPAEKSEPAFGISFAKVEMVEVGKLNAFACSPPPIKRTSRGQSGNTPYHRPTNRRMVRPAPAWSGRVLSCAHRTGTGGFLHCN